MCVDIFEEEKESRGVHSKEWRIQEIFRVESQNLCSETVVTGDTLGHEPTSHFIMKLWELFT